MCGRYTYAASPEALAETFALYEIPALTPRYNIAPTQLVAAIRIQPDSSKRECRQLRWGLIPSWSKDPAIGNRLINARAETVATKPAFRGPFKRRRCLLPATGFFEWRKEGRSKTPYLIRLRSRAPFAFAGLWDRWEPTGGEPVESCTILTTEANELMAPIHDRMPVILDPGEFARWLDPEVQTADDLLPLLSPYPADQMEVFPVSRMVNNPRNESPECVKPVSDV